MSRLTYRQRHRRIRQNLEEAWKASAMTAADPGLRDVYASIPRAPIRLITSPLRIDANQGGILRLADAFRLEAVDLAREPDRATDFSGGVGASSWQPYRWIEPREAVREAKERGYRVYGLTLAAHSIPIRQAVWRFPAALVLGEEKQGLDAGLEQACDELFGIPLYGLMASLNVGMAAAIALAEAVSAYAEQNPEFEPVRNASRRLLGLAEADYRQASPKG